MPLTPKQQRFVDEYLIDLNATQAAIRAGYSPRTATEQGSRLLTYAQVRAAVDAGRQKASESAALTVQGHLETLAELRDAAKKEGAYAAAVQAESLRGKVCGFYKEKVEHSGEVQSGVVLLPSLGATVQ